MKIYVMMFGHTFANKMLLRDIVMVSESSEGFPRKLVRRNVAPGIFRAVHSPKKEDPASCAGNSSNSKLPAKR
jgi:hypothetical protein